MTAPHNPPAFPAQTSCDPHSGMTLRDWFAGQALAGLLSGTLADGSALSGQSPEILSDSAFAFADAMLAARGDA